MGGDGIGSLVSEASLTSAKDEDPLNGYCD
jgi:hypothetical protein